MKRIPLLALALLGLLAPLRAWGDPTPAPTPDPSRVFTDPAMTFVAPAAFHKLPVQAHDPAKFEDGKAVVAVFVRDAKTRNMTTISITQDEFPKPDAKAFAEAADNDLRGGSDNAFIKRYDAQLANGMPAVFEEVTVGSGFDQVLSYRYLWADGVRGIIVTETAVNGVIDDRKAKADMANLTATAYPRYQY